MSHYVQEIIDSVNVTHSGLGELAGICALGAKAHRAILIVSPSGCGKSRVMDWVCDSYKDSIKLIKLSMTGLAVRFKDIEHFTSVLMIDDIATINTEYARATSITSLTGLCYTHYANSAMGGQGNYWEIKDFYGSALIGIQPVILRSVMQSPDWDASIQDKCLRYYHLQRPIIPNFSLPLLPAKHGIDIEQVEDYEPDNRNIHWQRLKQLAVMQWSTARAKEHLILYLKAMSALDSRKTINESDLEILERLLRPMAYEQIVVSKLQLEGQRELNNNLLSLLTEYRSYGGKFTLSHVSLDYKVLPAQAYAIIRNQNGYWQEISKKPVVYTASEKLRAELKKYRLEVEGK